MEFGFDRRVAKSYSTVKHISKILSGFRYREIPLHNKNILLIFEFSGFLLLLCFYKLDEIS